MAWTLSAGPRGSFVPDACASGGRLIASAGAVLASRLGAASPLKLTLAAHVAAVVMVLHVLPDDIVAIALSATSLLLTMLVVLALPAGAGRLAMPGVEARLDEELPAREQAALPASEAGSANGGGEELASLVAERQIQRALQARHDATALRGSAIDGGHAWAALMARISHEIRTPLNAVIGFSDLMQAELFGPLGHSRYAEYVDHIRDSGKALLKSAEDTLAMTSLLAADPSPLTAVPLWDIVEDAWSFLAAEAAAKRVTLELPPEVRVDLLAERRALRQIVLNLLSEAVTRAEAGCTITLGVSTDGCLALVDIVVPRATTIASCGDQTLGLSIARALLELKGSELVEWRHGDRGWRVATVLELAVQADFFASAS